MEYLQYLRPEEYFQCFTVSLESGSDAYPQACFSWCFRIRPSEDDHTGEFTNSWDGNAPRRADVLGRGHGSRRMRDEKPELVVDLEVPQPLRKYGVIPSETPSHARADVAIRSPSPALQSTANPSDVLQSDFVADSNFPDQAVSSRQATRLSQAAVADMAEIRGGGSKRKTGRGIKTGRESRPGQRDSRLPSIRNSSR